MNEWLVVGSVILAAIAAVITILALKGKYGMIAIGLLVRICLVVGAIRLAKPTSVWARTFYDRDRLHEALRRFPLSGEQIPTPQIPTPQSPRPPASPGESAFHLAVMLAAACTLVVQPVAGLMFGVALPLVRFSLAGLRWARLAVVGLTGASVLMGAVSAVFAALNGRTGPVLIATVAVLVWLGALAWVRYASPSSPGRDAVPAGPADDLWR